MKTDLEFPATAELPSKAALPDPLLMFDGRPVNIPAQWYAERRPELKRLFAHYMYGPIPPAPRNLTVEVLGEYGDFLEGKANLKLVRLVTGTETNAPRIDLMLVTPKHVARAPVFLAMNFCGNHALTPDPRVPLNPNWVPEGCGGSSSNRATEASRGAQAKDWPLEEIIARGYALAAFYSGDVDSDRAGVSSGLYAWLSRNPAQAQPHDRGTIAAWAWGFHRCVDYLVSDAAVDPGRIAAVGHSRNGKTALLAAAYDERIGIAYPHQAGCGGSAPSRGKVGESVKQINDRFPHWFNRRFKDFNEAPERLPFDQHALVALCAPRAVLFSAAQEDQWANPTGQFEVLKAADPVYRFLGSPGLATEQMPGFGQLVGSRLGYYIRPGAHSMRADDWKIFLDFADRQWKSTTEK